MPRKTHNVYVNASSNNSMEVDSDNEPGPSHRGFRSTRRNTQRTQDSADEEPATQTRSSQRLTQRSIQQRQLIDDDDEPRTQSRRKGQELPAEEEEHVLGTLIKYLLAACSTKLPIKQTDIKHKAIPSHEKYYASLMAKAKTIFHEIFGYKLVNLSGGKWIIVNALPRQQIRLEPTDIPERTLLFIILSHIYMSGGYCREDNLFEFLKLLNIMVGQPHEYFGNVQELITKTFVQQLYFLRNKIVDGENEVFEYTWGERAKEEVDPRDVMDFVSKVFKKPATHWPQQHRRAFMEQP